jgi:hypothetical protein
MEGKELKKELCMPASNADASATHASNQPTFIEVLLDESGSMSSCSAATITGFNNFVREQREVGGDCYLTLTKFDTNGLRTPYQNLRIESVPNLDFFPHSGTPLWEVVGKRTKEVLERPRVGRTLIVVITDGKNTQRQGEFPTAESVRDIVTRATEGGITYLYFGAGQGAKQSALEMGIPDSVITVFDTREMGAAMTAVSAQTRAFRVGA